MKLFALIFLFLFSTVMFDFALATDADQKETDNQEPDPLHLPIENQHNYFGVRLININGLSLTYAHRFGAQWLIGGSVTTALYNIGDDRSGTGDLNAGTYYAEAGKVSIAAAEINGTYFFREEGYKKFGFLIRGGVGTVQGSMTGKFYRYDKDPAIFQFGDGKRLQETGPEVRNDYRSAYARFGAYYQFVWTPRRGTIIGGHILEVGVSAISLDAPPSLKVPRANATIRVLDSEKTLPAAEVAYMFVF